MNQLSPLILIEQLPLLRPLAFISCRITSIHVFFDLPCALLTCPKLIRSTRRTGASAGLCRTRLNHRRRFSLIFTYILYRINRRPEECLFKKDMEDSASCTSISSRFSRQVSGRKRKGLNQEQQ